MASIPGFHDPFSSLSHLLAAGVFLLLSFRLVARGEGRLAHTISLATFSLSCVLQLALSGVYHLLSPGTGGRAVLQRLDHAAIFILIAGTFTAGHGILCTGIARWGMLGLIWAGAITGITLKTVFFSSVPEILGLSLYVGLGWVGLVSAILFARRYGVAFVAPLVGGGVCYTAGGVLEFANRPTLIPSVIGPHELFHIAVIGGIGFHWKFVSSFATPSWVPGIAPPPST